jgi:NADP-dependent 3-hydroxy acid dehydrogenase YdfG
MTLVLNAGASSPLLPLTKHTWETFSLNWQVDVQQALYWTQQALALPLAAGSTVVEFSSGAAVRGSPMSGGYAGAKATIKFIAAYAAEQSHREGLGIRFSAVLPQLTPTGLGAPAVAAYADLQGVDVPTFLARSGPAPTPDDVAAAVLDLVTNPDRDQPAYLITAAGLTPTPQ